jgi:DNA-binding winged helix-turn-helix (wHTH) protein
MPAIPHENSGLLEFGEYRIDGAQKLLLRGADVVPLAPKVFDTLLVLATARGRVVEKEELLKRIWPETFVEEGSLARNVSTLRRILGGEGGDQKYIETIPKRGYRFVGSIRSLPENLLVKPSSAWSTRPRGRAILVSSVRHSGDGPGSSDFRPSLLPLSSS